MRKILFVDDDHIVTKGLRKMLIQKDRSSDITAHTSPDKLYLQTLNLTDTDKFSERVEYYNKIILEEVLG